MTPIRVYLDEDVHHLIARALGLRGWDVLTPKGVGLLTSTDDEQIEFAAKNGYTLLTYNISDYPRLHHERMADGGHHCGIIIASQEDPGANVKAMLSLLSNFSTEDLVDQLLYLNNWMEPS